MRPGARRRSNRLDSVSTIPSRRSRAFKDDSRYFAAGVMRNVALTFSIGTILRFCWFSGFPSCRKGTLTVSLQD